MQVRNKKYSHFLESIHLLWPINLNMRYVFRRERDVEEVFLVCFCHFVCVSSLSVLYIPSNVYYSVLVLYSTLSSYLLLQTSLSVLLFALVVFAYVDG